MHARTITTNTPLHSMNKRAVAARRLARYNGNISLHIPMRAIPGIESFKNDIQCLLGPAPLKKLVPPCGNTSRRILPFAKHTQ